jgi:hypothetical protein
MISQYYEVVDKGAVVKLTEEISVFILHVTLRKKMVVKLKKVMKQPYN